MMHLVLDASFGRLFGFGENTVLRCVQTSRR